MSEEFRYIVRVAGKDLNGLDKTFYALHRVKGIGINTAYLVARLAGIDPERRLGTLSEEEVKRLEDVIAKLPSLGLPGWYMNRPRDPETGRDMHLIGSDLVLKVKGDIDLMKSIKSWKGVRHALGLKVRGQRTKTTGRTGMTVGVTRKPKKR